MTPVIVACVWVRGNVPYEREYVTRLRSMVRRNLDRPFEFVCLTDRPWDLPGTINTMPIQHNPRLAGWWSKIELFRPGRFTEGRVLYLDLDTLVVSGLEPIVEYPATFALCPHAGTFEGKDGKAVVKRFNSSVMIFDADSQPQIFQRFNMAVTKRLWGDQDLIGEVCENAETMPADWFPRLSTVAPQEPPKTARVVLCKKPKNTEAAKRYPWFREAWA